MRRRGQDPIERALVLAGGGGRGAYQVGVCQVLEELGWEPDLVLGNSIGATNGAILIAPESEISGARLLDQIWREEMLSDQIQEASADWPWPIPAIMSILVNLLLAVQEPPDPLAGVEALEMSLDVSAEMAFETAQDKRSLREWIKASFQVIRPTLEERLKEAAVLDRDGWREVLRRHVNLAWLNDADAPYYGITTTDVATGALRVFWNRVPEGVQGTPTRIAISHIMASSSIPGFYEATMVEGRYWWDGVLNTNVPLAPAIDAGATDIIVVLMTPWFEQAEGPGVPVHGDFPTVLDALDRFLDWMMLGPFRSEMARLDEEKRKRVRIISPQRLWGAVSILDYDQEDNEKLIKLGIQDARRILGA